MERRAELNTKARDLERRGAVDAALQAYLGLAADSTAAASGSLWVQIGSLQRKLGQETTAEDSYLHAVTSFSESGQLNNALAVCFLLLEMNPDSAGAHLKTAELALSLGYRKFARSAVAAYAREMSAGERAIDATGPLAAFLNRYSDEKTLWQDWVADLLDRGKETEAVEALESLEALLAEGGNREESSRVGVELRRLRPSRRATDEPAPQAWESPARRDPAPEEAIPAAELPTLIENGPEDETPFDSVAPLPGLELTDIGSDSTWEPADENESISLLDNWDQEPGGIAEPAVGESLLESTDQESDGDPDAAIGEPVPLLGSWDDDAGPDATPALGDPVPVLGSWDDDAGDAAPSIDEPALIDSWDDQTPTTDLDPPFDELEENTDELEPLVFLTSFEAKPAEVAVPDAETMDVDRIAAELQRLTTKEVDDVDSHTHFDLGVAFKEMGLWEESLANLAKAMSEGHDPIAILEVVGEILVERGEDDLTRRLLGGVPGAGSTASPELAGVHYWLGRIAERQGAPEEARELFQLVVDVHPDFMDAGQRLRQLAPRTF